MQNAGDADSQAGIAVRWQLLEMAPFHAKGHVDENDGWEEKEGQTQQEQSGTDEEYHGRSATHLVWMAQDREEWRNMTRVITRSRTNTTRPHRVTR